MANRSETGLAPYAVRSDRCGGRAYPEPDDPLRNPFELDRHRIIESTAFRRLENKTQVFAPSHHDHFRTRLTHTLEAAQIGRCLAGALRANEALAEAITLAHDLGHGPFGHAGEAALDEAMAHCGGFNHNTHSLRVVVYLEHPFPAFRGLNLTEETRNGLATHATRYDTPPQTPDASASVEAQLASIADRIAYNCHDLEDAIGAEFVGMAELEELTLWCKVHETLSKEHRAKPIHAVRRLLLDAMLNTLLIDVAEASGQRLAPIQSPQQAKMAEQPLVAISSSMDRQLGELEDFLRNQVYKHADVAAMDARGRRMILDLFDAYRTNPAGLPERFRVRIAEQGLDRVICDYIAGMTDRFCTAEHDRLVQT